MAQPTCPKSGEAFLGELKRTAGVLGAQILFVSGLSSLPPHSLDANVLTIVLWANSHVRPPTPELARVTSPSWVCLSSYGEGRWDLFHLRQTPFQGTPPPPCQGRLQRACAFITPLIIKKFLTYCLLFIYLAVPGLSCSLQDLFKLRRMGSSSLTKDCAGDPCIRSQESYPLDHQGSPQKI